MNKPGHDSDCACLSCNPSEPGQNAFQQLCGGCARPVREVEEGVWVLHGSDECEAGGVHSPPAPSPPPLAKLYLYRSTEHKETYWWNSTPSGEWTKEIEEATIYQRTRPGMGGEWVEFTEVPF